MYCKNCNKLYAAKYKFCSQCGQPLVDELKLYGMQLLQGDANAFRKIYETTYGWVEREMKRRGVLSADVEDCMQEFYLKIYKGMATFDTEKGEFRSWFNETLTNRLIDYYRKSQRLTDHELHLYANQNSEDEDRDEDQFAWAETTEYLPDEAIDQQETRRLIYEGLDQLTEVQKHCIIMRFEKQMKVSEIAEALDISEGTVKSAVSYGKKKIKEYVLELEKKGTKLYGMAPLPFFFWLLSKVDFETGAADRVWNNVSQQVLSVQNTAAQAAGHTAKEAAAGTQAEATSAGTKAAATASKAAAATASGTAKGALTKAIIGIVVAAGIVGGGAGAYVHHKNAAQPVQEEKQEAEKPAKEEKAEEVNIYQLYYDKILELEQQYGEIGIYDFDMQGYTGLCYADLIDADQDGQEELMVAYRKNDSYKVEIWDVDESALRQIYDGDGDIGFDAVYLEKKEIDGKLCLISGESLEEESEQLNVFSYNEEQKQFVEEVSLYLAEDEYATIQTRTVNGESVSDEEYNEQRDKYISDTEWAVLASYSLESDEELAPENAKQMLETTKQILREKLGIKDETGSDTDETDENKSAKEAFDSLLSGSDYLEAWGNNTTSSDISFQYYELTSEKIPVLIAYSEVGIHHDMYRVYQYVDGQVQLAVRTAQIDNVYLQSGLISGYDSGMGTITETFYRFSDKNTIGETEKTFETHDYDDNDVVEQFEEDVASYPNGEIGVAIDSSTLLKNTAENRESALK